MVHIGSSFADRRDDTRKAGTSVLQQEIERLRLELSAERAQKMCLEQTTSSLQNALSFSKKKVNEQQETISRLEGDVRRAQSLAPCLKEILSGTFVCARTLVSGGMTDGTQSLRDTMALRNSPLNASFRACRLNATRLLKCRNALTL